MLTIGKHAQAETLIKYHRKSSASRQVIDGMTNQVRLCSSCLEMDAESGTKCLATKSP